MTKMNTNIIIKTLLLNRLIKAESLHFHQILLKIHCGDVKRYSYKNHVSVQILMGSYAHRS